jgi:tRNA nucleotidyltransferase/poly(A) polymerase
MELLDKIRKVIENTEFANKTFIAGGWVRDKVMGNESKDIDIVVELPNGGVKLAEFLTDKLNGTNVVIFSRFGTAQIVLDDIDVEFVMTRKEEYDGITRKPIVTFGTIIDDVMRRDFTINSLLYNIITEEILDLTGKGLDDIHNKIVKTTGEPNFIFNQDPLRLMRAVRFAARFNFKIELNTLTAIVNNWILLNKISKERIQEELIKILGSKNPVEGIKLLIDTHLIDVFLPEIYTCIGVKQNEHHTKDVLNHIFDVIENIKPTALHRLTALLHDIAKPICKSITETGIHFYDHHIKSADITQRVMTDLKFSNEDIELVTSTVKNHMIFMNPDSRNKKIIRRWRMKLGETKFNFLLDLMEADIKSCTEVKNWVEEIRQMQIIETPIVKLPVDGNDIMTLFNIKPGPKVKEIKDKVIDWVCEEPEITREEIIKELKIKL